jgi:transcriptional regulator with XRE-family HTH domain
MAKYVTIMDIARELGISKSTVSRALSGDTGNVKAETLQKILATAERMGYILNCYMFHHDVFIKIRSSFKIVDANIQLFL